jgi:Rrf2 family protein
MLSRTGIHALRALAILAGLPEGEFRGAVALAAVAGAPPNYLGKLLQQLARARLLAGRKGFGGGFRLARPAAEISLYDVVAPLEQLERWEGCILGSAACREDAPCALHGQFAAVRDAWIAMLKRTTLADLIAHGEALLDAQQG